MKPIIDGTEETKSHWHSSYHSHRPIITVDFDHTITKTCPACPDWTGEYVLQDGVKEALEKLHKDFDIIILSGGGNYVKNYKAIIECVLDSNEIPHDGIVVKKPPACFMIDDRAIHHIGWESTLETIRKRRDMIGGKSE